MIWWSCIQFTQLNLQEVWTAKFFWIQKLYISRISYTPVRKYWQTWTSSHVFHMISRDFKRHPPWNVGSKWDKINKTKAWRNLHVLSGFYQRWGSIEEGNFGQSPRCVDFFGNFMNQFVTSKKPKPRIHQLNGKKQGLKCF